MFPWFADVCHYCVLKILLPRKVTTLSDSSIDDEIDVNSGSKPSIAASGSIHRGMLPRRVRQIACGQHHSLFLLDDGDLLSCGNNDCGQLGREGPRTIPSEFMCVAGSLCADGSLVNFLAPAKRVTPSIRIKNSLVCDFQCVLFFDIVCGPKMSTHSSNCLAGFR